MSNTLTDQERIANVLTEGLAHTKARSRRAQRKAEREQNALKQRSSVESSIRSAVAFVMTRVRFYFEARSPEARRRAVFDEIRKRRDAAKALNTPPSLAEVDFRLREIVSTIGVPGVGELLAEMYEYMAGGLSTERRTQLDALLTDPLSDASLMMDAAMDYTEQRLARDEEPAEFVNALMRLSFERQAAGFDGLEYDPQEPPPPSGTSRHRQHLGTPEQFKRDSDH